MSDFTHLHLHTEYSLLDGANKITELAKTLKERGVKSVAITDHGNMFGAIDFYKTMVAHDIKPIIGIEAYIHNHDELSDTSDKQRFHLILLAKNEIGYKNLMYLSSMAYIEGFYYNPRINKKILRRHSEGIICSAACLQGEVSFHLNQSERNLRRGAKGYDRAKEVALEYKEIFGDDFYLEIMRHGISDQRRIDDNILRISKETGIKIIATNDAHYTFKQRAEAHEVFMCIAMNKKLNDPNRLRHTVHEFYVKNDEEMNKIFADIPEVILNTQEIVEKCNLELNLGNPTPPKFKFTLEYAKNRNLTLPEPDEPYSMENDGALFEYESREGLKRRLQFIPKEKHEEYKKRLEEEISTIKNMKFSGYMLIVADFINEAKSRGIPVGPGRGSAAGSLVAYSLNITDLDPIPYSLLFERFLNPERVSMPDIDVDFCQNRRGEVIDYVIEKYGKYNVAQVATFGKLLAKGVIRDVARVCDMEYKEADAMAKLIPDELKITLKDAFEKEPKIAELINENAMAKQIWKFSNDLEGLNRNAGMHAAGVVISNEELWNKAPLFKQSNAEAGHYVTQYTKDYLEDVDLIKFDFLGLKTLTVIDNAIKLIKKRSNKDIMWENIDFNEPGVYKTIQSGNTLGIFQIESGGMQELAASLRPDCFEDIIAMIALYRPGPLNSGMVSDFIKRKHGEEPISYAFNDLKDILEPTYGVIVYQEQVMQIVQRVGGFSLGGADIVRRAMSKKKESTMKKLKGDYLSGAKNGGYGEKKADELFELIMKFAEYGFNKSHSAAYALITFQTAYLKTHYPAEFMAALLTSEESNMDKIVRYIDEIKRLKIKILPPSINNSIHEFSVVADSDGDAIVFGLGAIKGVGSAAIENIVNERENKLFASIDDFVSRIDSFKVNKKTIDSLIKAGAMDCLGLTRMTLVQNIENILEACKNAAIIKKNAAESLFSSDDSMTNVSVNLIKTTEELPLKQLLKNEQESLGIYLSGHPLREHEDKINAVKYTPTSQFSELNDSCEILCIGKIEDISTKITKSGKKMGIINILDLHGTFEMVAFDQELREITALDGDELDMPHVFKVRLIKEGVQNRLTLLTMMSLDEAKNGDIKLNTIRKNGKFNSQNGFSRTQKATVKIIENFEFEINIKSLNKEKITQIYTLAHNEHRSQNRSKKLILKIKVEGDILEYETPFLVSDNFKQKAEEILAS